MLYNNVLNVSALNNIVLRYDANTGTIKVRDGIKGSPIITLFSNGAKYAEDMGIAAAGHYLMSANSAFKSPGENIDIPSSGTSMAAPVVTGSGGLVQQAFPYLSAKQIGDVLLSTSSPIETKKGEDSYVAVISYNSDASISRYLGAPSVDLNVYYFDDKDKVGEKDRDGLIAAALEQWESITEIAQSNRIRVFIEQGISNTKPSVVNLGYV